MELIRDSKWVGLLRSSRCQEFNKLAATEPPDLHNTDLRMLDLRKADLSRANLSGAYLRNCDLRGLDFTVANLEGASIHDANVAGVLFPAALSPEEIRLSIDLGTRMRYRRAGE
jgi:uncharacterized protein YjbI with pentapeptide repeats